MLNFFVERAFIGSAWGRSVRIEVNDDGYISHISTGATAENAIRLKGTMLPAVANLHSHAFQRAMAGLTEVAGNPRDSFWTWREQMYRLVSRMTPDEIGTIALHLYIKMLKSGYTQVGEFHYLHHSPEGTAYQNDDMLTHLIAAAKSSGIAQTLLPVLYTYSGFGSQAPTEGQRRFIQSADQFLTQHQRLDQLIASEQLINKGICFHSLRAVSEQQIHLVLNNLSKELPVHIHISEQMKEVNDCIAWSNQRPVEWLMSHIDVTSRWCMVHATHLSDIELKQLAASHAVAGLCPTTEANLGDGLFRADEFLEFGGKWGIGSDSHVSVNLNEELRWLEYGQRLRDQRRNRLVTRENPKVGEVLYSQAAAGGSQACGVASGELAVGMRADWIVLDDNEWLNYCPDEQVINRWLFAGESSHIRQVYVAGKAVIQDGHHALEEKAEFEFSRVMKSLF